MTHPSIREQNRQQIEALRVPIEAQTGVATGRRPCCADLAAVVFCTGEIDTWRCGICGFVWDAPCR